MDLLSVKQMLILYNDERENKEIQMLETFLFSHFSWQIPETHTGVHRFTRISQIFQNDSEIQERGLEGVKIQKPAV